MRSPRRHRPQDAEAVRRVYALASGSPSEKVEAKLAEAREVGQDPTRLALGLGLTPAQVEAALTELSVVRVGSRVLLQDLFEDLGHQALEAVHQFHAAHPTQRGMPREELRRRLSPNLAPAVFGGVIEALVQQGTAATEDGLVRETGFSPEAMLSPVERAIAEEIEAQFRRGGLKPPNLKDVVGTDRRRGNLYHFLREAHRLVETTDRTSNRVVIFHAAALAAAERVLQNQLSRTDGATVSELNQMLDTTRKNAIPLLEYFDARGLTQRVGDLRVWRGGDDE